MFLLLLSFLFLSLPFFSGRGIIPCCLKRQQKVGFYFKCFDHPERYFTPWSLFLQGQFFCPVKVHWFSAFWLSTMTSDACSFQMQTRLHTTVVKQWGLYLSHATGMSEVDGPGPYVTQWCLEIQYPFIFFFYHPGASPQSHNIAIDCALSSLFQGRKKKKKKRRKSKKGWRALLGRKVCLL